jgi:Leucine-rich repeat (LRR) protein
MVGLLLFCVVGFFTVAFGQQAPSKVVFKAICENGTEGCTVERDCGSIIASSQKIRLIEESTLAGCGGVGYLDLGSNNISEISKNAFQGQRKLQKLYLTNNQIKVLETGVFDPLTSLTHLWLSENLIEVIEDSLFSKNVKLEELYLRENKIVAVGPNAIKHLTNLKELRLFGNPCMHPNVTWGKNPQNLGVFFSAESGYRKWHNENNACVSSYSVQRCFNKFNIEKENLEKKLTDLSGTTENCKNELSDTKAGKQKIQNDIKACRIESENCEFENESERGKSFKIILVLSIIIILLLLVIIGLSVMNWKLKSKMSDQKDQIIRLDRLAPKHIYEQVDQEPEPEPQYEEIQ